MYLMIIFLWIPYSQTLEGQNVCKRYKSAIDNQGNRVNVIDEFCCEGFKEQDNKCIECTECSHDTECPEGFCGDGCIQQCDCPTLSRCDSKYCCICSAGFTGRSCDQPCPNGYFGENCVNACSCSGQATCDTVSGHCLCNAGWTGYDCDQVITNYNNVTCPTKCNCSDPRCIPEKEECQCQSSNTTYTENYSTEYPVTKSTQQPNSSVFTILAMSASLLSVLVIFLFSVALVVIIMTVRKNYRLSEVVLNDDGHYDEINPYNEISQEELERLRIPYYSSPNETSGIQRTRSLPYIKLPNNTFTKSIACSESQCDLTEIHKYLSLPNLNDQVNNYTSLIKTEYNKPYQTLKTGSNGNRNPSGFLNPYFRLQSSQIIGSGYLHPYSAVKNKDSRSLENESSDCRLDLNIQVEIGSPSSPC